MDYVKLNLVNLFLADLFLIDLIIRPANRRIGKNVVSPEQHGKHNVEKQVYISS